ncbi:MAG: S-layer homology domain-containing protein [bacterium]|nr:S-layer homology domain-containing protein [bacterium]
MNLKTMLPSLLLCLTVSAPAYADVLGTVTGEYSSSFGAGTQLYSKTYQSDSVGNQTEYYVEYTPNSDAVPVVENGASVWGTRTIYRAAWYLENNGYRPLIGINADFFSFQTGIPMGISISDGEILTKTDGELDAVGFRDDGTAFIDKLDIKTTLHTENGEANVECINRWYTKDYTPICLLTDKFAKTTHTSSPCLFLICTPENGSLSIGNELKLRIDEKFTYDGDIDIPDGKMILMISLTGIPELYSLLDSLTIGSSVSITNETSGSGAWSEAKNVIGTSAGRLLVNGQLGSGFEAGSAPRTAVGIRADGTIVFYVLDGRQTGHSYGARLETLALRMKELGCVDAINLDGGGSTAIGGVYPGSTGFAVLNSPSDGSPRSCANYIFLRDSRKPTGIPYSIHFTDDENRNYLDGSSLKLSYTDIYDTNGYPMDNLGGAEFGVENTGGAKTTADADGTYHFSGNGKSTVIITLGDAKLTGFTYNVYSEPDEIKLVNDSTGKVMDEIYLNPGESYSVDLGAYSYVNGVKLHAYDADYDWSIDGNIGSIDEHGMYTAKTDGDKAGKIIVEKNGVKQELNVFISDYSPEKEAGFADIELHWAKPQILRLAMRGIINGIELDGKMYFKPDDNMTRAEFAQIIAKYKALLQNQTEDIPPYTDWNDIPLWAQNAVKAVYKSGIMNGRSDDNGITYRFDPYASITRAEAMTVLGRLIPEMPEKTLDFADAADIPLWARASMGRLYYRGIIQGYSDNTILPSNNVKRAEAVTMLNNMEK